MDPPNIGIVFDLDDTLLDRSLTVGRFARDVVRLLAPTAPEPVDSIVQRVVDLDGQGYVGRGEFFAWLGEEYSLTATAKRAVETLFFDHVWRQPVVVAGVPEIMKAIAARGFRLGIVTNGSLEAQTSKLKCSGVDRLADAVVISAEVGAKKPDPVIFQAVIGQLKIAPERSWFIGDNPMNDIWGAKQVGFGTGWVHRNLAWRASVPPCYDVAGTNVTEVVDAVFARLEEHA